jgi:MbtH protein
MLGKLSKRQQAHKGAAMSWDHPETRFDVVINDEGQYSIWPDYKEVPQGWKKADMHGRKEECLTYIEQNWQDLRPLSLQRAMSATGEKT